MVYVCQEFFCTTRLNNHFFSSKKLYKQIAFLEKFPTALHDAYFENKIFSR